MQTTLISAICLARCITDKYLLRYIAHMPAKASLVHLHVTGGSPAKPKSRDTRVQLGFQPTLLLLARGPQNSPGLSQPQLSSPATARATEPPGAVGGGGGQAWKALLQGQTSTRPWLHQGRFDESKGTEGPAGRPAQHTASRALPTDTQAAAASWTLSPCDLQLTLLWASDMSFT